MSLLCVSLCVYFFMPETIVNTKSVIICMCCWRERERGGDLNQTQQLAANQWWGWGVYSDLLLLGCGLCWLLLCASSADAVQTNKQSIVYCLSPPCANEIQDKLLRTGQGYPMTNRICPVRWQTESVGNLLTFYLTALYVIDCSMCIHY